MDRIVQLQSSSLRLLELKGLVSLSFLSVILSKLFTLAMAYLLTRN